MIIDYVTRRVKRLWRKTFPRQEPKPTGGTRCRVIEPADLEGVIALLTKGFWQTRREHFEAIIRCLTEHHTPAGFPKYGYLLENEGRPVGVLLEIFAERVIAGERQIWCCGSSFYIEPSFRFYADFLLKRAQRFKDVTYLDLASSPKRWEAMAKQGYRRIAQGVYVAAPVLCRRMSGARCKIISGACTDTRLDQHEIELLTDHVRFKNTIALICEHEGEVYPFVFGFRRRRGVPFAFLLYSRNQADFVRFAGTIGRLLIKRGIPFVVFDTDGPIKGMPGKFAPWFPKFWKGGARPRLGDLAYTEIAMFGVI